MANGAVDGSSAGDEFTMKRIALTKGTVPDATVPGTHPKDYVVVDDIGEFTYYPSEGAMLEDLEYVDEAACVLDREGNDCRLTLDKDRDLCLGPSFGLVEFSWLRQAWMNNRHRNLQAHRLQRFFPATREALVAELFETLTLECARNANGTPWVLHVGGEEAHPATLRDLDGLLAGLDHLEQATVRDPFGHEYRPVRHQTHRHLAPGAGPIYYIEIHPRGRELRQPRVQH
ncbi:hypothetical protein [Arthrobacter sp. FW306-2-2C-D06B]|uniref:hypothetical protein n=1 Tax=Arthrobacter sp. FW306-2-2C-D06B TaxID=2879618 RepID=UPI001F312979|nr:hypothetical protein [Arthrobacter sp. FW306-2-2C-D06B]UKA58641.1 hypothetical protein LFT47_20635 [Arthrobacter sp. FW306-2-2C-D06B]